MNAYHPPLNPEHFDFDKIEVKTNKKNDNILVIKDPEIKGSMIFSVMDMVAELGMFTSSKKGVILELQI